MIHKFIDASQLLSQRGCYFPSSYFSVTTENDLRQLLVLRAQDERPIDRNFLIDVDYFLVTKTGNGGLAETSYGGSPICNLDWEWPRVGMRPLQYVGRVNLGDSIDLLPASFKKWAQKHVLQIFIPDVYMSDPRDEIVIQTVDLAKPVYKLPPHALPRGIMNIEEISVMRARVKCAPFIEYDDVLEELAQCNIWYPQGTRVPAFDAEADSFHVDLSGLDLYAEKGSERCEEIGVDIDSIEPAALDFLQLSGDFLTVHAKYAEQVGLKGTMEYD